MTPVSCGSGSYNYTGDNPIKKSVNIQYSAVYSEDYNGVMIQIFSADDCNESYSFYGQATCGISDVNSQNPTILSETTALTTEMGILSAAAGGGHISVSYYDAKEKSE